MAIRTGLASRRSHRVSEADTAVALGSGTVPVLATPRLLAWCEEAACRTLEGSLAPGTTSVGWRVRLVHSRPTAVGGQVVVEAVLERVEGRRLTFAVSARDAAGVMVGAGRLIRVIVETAAFLERSW